MSIPTSRSTAIPARALGAILALACVLAGPSAAFAEQPVRVGGTGSAVAAMGRLGSAAALQDAGIRVRVVPSLGSTGAIRAVADGVLEVGMSGRTLREAERALGLASREVARTPFVFAVGPRVRVSGLTTEELVAIYQGERLAWPDGQRIRPVLRPRSDADTDLLRAISPEVAAAVDAAAGRPGMLVAVTNTECNDMLARSPGSIGPSTLLQVRSESQPVRPLLWNGVEPTVENLASGRYPLVKSIHLVFRAPAGDGVRRLLAFLRSPRGTSLLRELGALPLDFSPVD
jgi:phosphate transport system substrate-binding protein